MSTSSEHVVLRGLPVDAVVAADAGSDLRHGDWTRFGTVGVRGDAATEGTLRALVEQSREAGRAQGFAAGWVEGRRGAAASTAATHEQQVRAFETESRRLLDEQRSAVVALVAAADLMQASTTALQAELAEQTVEIALQIAAAVLGREVVSLDDPAADAVRRALRDVPLDVALTVRLHPADRAGLDPAVLADRAATLETDPLLARGDALVETPSGLVDATVASALTRVREVLGR